jgi:hypothetical protein
MGVNDNNAELNAFLIGRLADALPRFEGMTAEGKQRLT